jgi:hypothetical protein
MICPACRTDVNPTPVGFTWWGGLLGAKLLSHVECPSCKARFNGKTGQDNTSAIVLYCVVVGAFMIGLVYVIWSL